MAHPRTIARSTDTTITVAIVGAGASGTLAAIALADQARELDQPLEVVMLDPRPETGRGVAYSTAEPQHLLNVPAGRMSAFPDACDDFLTWLRNGPLPAATTTDFVARDLFGRYLSARLDDAVRASAHTVSVIRRCQSVTSIEPLAQGCRLRTGAGDDVYVDHAVLALGAPEPSAAWAPETLQASGLLIPDPWRPGALDAVNRDHVGQDVLLVGSGLTMADAALVLLRDPNRIVHAVSRRGRLPLTHARQPSTPLPPTPEPDPTQLLTLAELRRFLRSRLEESISRDGDWRPAIDALRPITARLWGQLPERDRATFLAHDAPLWDVHRHRMAPQTADALDAAAKSGRLVLHRGCVTAAKPVASGIEVELTDGFAPVVASVVNCTGPGAATGRRPRLLDDVVSRGDGRPGPCGLGVDTDDLGWLIDAHGRRSTALSTLGPPRIGTLWETTAIPEIRVQARALAREILAPVRPITLPVGA